MLSAATRLKQLGSALAELHERVCQQLGRGASDVDSLAAAVTCLLPVMIRHREAFTAGRDWLNAAGTWTMSVIDDCEAALELNAEPAGRIAELTRDDHDESLLWTLYELLLSRITTGQRRASGTFYTPPSIARYMVAEVDRRFRLADIRPGYMLEPACGSGVFLVEVIERVLRCDAAPAQTAAEFLPRLIGIDLSPVAICLTRVRIALTLQEFGIELTSEFPQPRLIAGNALAGPDHIAELNLPITVVIGNPPFSYLSRNEQPWIQSLIRGADEHAGYFAINGQALGERKTWLHDDYVKFIRLAQWCIDRASSGVVSLVTNQSWLDNATFRIARQQLLRTFPQIEIVDLHGDFARHSLSPSLERDENVFGIRQGIAIATFVKGPKSIAASVKYADLWGTRDDKLQGLDQPLQHTTLQPQLPWFTFVPQRQEVPAEYAAAPLLTSLMPVNSTVPVTARDHFVIARTREELLQRIDEFRDPRISDEVIRKQYFGRTRSSRYEPGDTRSWKLSAARCALMEEPESAKYIRRCLYRPFVWRYIFWHPALIDWPRVEITRHLLREVKPPNLALLARRQSLAGKACDFFWITNCLPLDGVIRSDNRGSESFFPLWLIGKNDEPARANFSPQVLAETSASPETLLQYLYALFHSRTYRTRYAAGLAMEFPRALIPTERERFHSLARIGQRLIELHLTDPQQEFKFEISDFKSQIVDFTQQIEDFHVGTYNVCRKWLQMEQASRESAGFHRLQQLIAETIHLQQQIDEQIAMSGVGSLWRTTS